MSEHTVYLALGSNLGDRVQNLHAALRAIARFATVDDTSFLYATPPAYVTDQPEFLNAVCRVRTRHSPEELLGAVERAMAELGRQRTVRYGPRIIDIDILLYDDLHVATDALVVPHPRMIERDFVLEPLCDLAAGLVHPTLGVSMRELWRRLERPPLPRVMPFGSHLWTWGAKTYVMGILNVTPDSFSGDGLGEAGPEVVDEAVAQAERFVAAGADCLDVGGHSTRPGHPLLPEALEIARVTPVIRALAQAVNVPISVDTFRAGVAQAALHAGAHAVNDVWGLHFDPALATVAATARVPLMLMHNRLAVDYADALAVPPAGAPYAYADVVDDVRLELAWSLETARTRGVARWHMVVDPGVGFGKNPAQNLGLIDRLDEVKAAGFPLLFGPSRKGFIGKVLGGLPPEERLEGTLAACALAVDRGADILRVHDVQAVVRTAQLVDAVVRR